MSDVGQAERELTAAGRFYKEAIAARMYVEQERASCRGSSLATVMIDNLAKRIVDEARARVAYEEALRRYYEQERGG